MGNKRVNALIAAVGLAEMMALSQPIAILSDLERRAVTALENSERLNTPAEIRLYQARVRARLSQTIQEAEDSPGVIQAKLSLPESIDGPFPAVLHLRLHRDADIGDYDQKLSALGFVVLSLDLVAEHSGPNLLRRGVLPEVLIQRAVQSGFEYLSSRADVDKARIAIAGVGLGVVIGAMANPAFSAVVVSEVGLDLAEMIRGHRPGDRTVVLDPCLLLPGLAQYASPVRLLAAVSPRPQLILDAPFKSIDLVNEVYGAMGVRENVSLQESDGSLEQRAAIELTWFARWLQTPPSRPRVTSELHVLSTSISIGLGRRPPVDSARSKKITLANLTESLGEPLPAARMTRAIEIARKQEITLPTQVDMQVPVSVYRPGPQGGDFHVGVLVAIDDQGRDHLERDPVVQAAVQRGWMVYAIDPRGLGELKTNDDEFIFGVSLLLGENFVWRQAFDIARVVQFTAAASVGMRSRLYASGKVSILASLYSAVICGDGFSEQLILRDTPSSISDTTETPLYAINYGQYRFRLRELLEVVKPTIIVVNGDESQITW